MWCKVLSRFTTSFTLRASPGRRSFSMAAYGVRESWKEAGRGKGPGIPAPSGQYRVGCVDLMHQLEGDDRGLLVRLYYPTEATPEAGYSYSDWHPHRNYIKGFLDFANVNFTGDLSKFTIPQMPALEFAPVSQQAARSFPVVVFSHGLGGMRTTNSAVLCDLASHGYVVASVEHRDGSACMTLQRVPRAGGREGELEDSWVPHYHLTDQDREFPVRNRQVKLRADDVKKSLDVLTLLNQGTEVRNMLNSSYDFRQFRGCLDMTRAALMGHSFGGGTTVLALSQDARFKCGVVMDCWMYPLHEDFYKRPSISQPLYFINSYSFQWPLNVRRMLQLTMPPDTSGKTQCRVLTLDGTHHFNQCDVPFVASKTLTRMGLKESRLDNAVAHRVNLDICHAFLKRHLLNDPAYQSTVPDLDGTVGHSQHIIFGTNVDLTDSAPRKPSWDQIDSNL